MQEAAHLGRRLLAQALLDELVRPLEQAVGGGGQQRQLLHVIRGEPARAALLLGRVASDLGEVLLAWMSDCVSANLASYRDSLMIATLQPGKCWNMW